MRVPNIAKFAADTDADGCAEPGMALPKISYLAFDNGFLDEDDSHNPLVIRKNKLGFDNSTTNTDHKILVTIYAAIKFRLFMRTLIKIIYCNLIKDIELHILQIVLLNQMIVDTQFIKLLKAGLKLAKKANTLCLSCNRFLDKNCPECVDRELIRDHVEDMEFIPFDNKGLIIQDTSGNYPAPELTGIRDRLFDINGVDVRLTFRSKENFLKKKHQIAKKDLLLD